MHRIRSSLGYKKTWDSLNISEVVKKKNLKSFRLLHALVRFTWYQRLGRIFGSSFHFIIENLTMCYLEALFHKISFMENVARIFYLQSISARVHKWVFSSTIANSQSDMIMWCMRKKTRSSSNASIEIIFS